MSKRSLVAVLFVLLLSSQVCQVHAEFIPVFYERSSSIGSAPILPLGVNSSGEYLVLNPQRSELIILNNALNEVKRVQLPAAYSQWYNEIAVGPDDTVWISSGYYYAQRKVFLKYDSSGNLLDIFQHENTRMALVSNFGIQLDKDGYLYFICSIYSPNNNITTYLHKLDPQDGSLVSSWEVPVDGPSQWYRGLGINAQGEMLWGNFESRTIYKFNPSAGQTVSFSFLPATSQNNTSSLSLSQEDNLYVLEQPSVYWRYHPSYLHLFGPEGTYRGKREIDFRVAGVSLATFEDEIVLSSYLTGILIKYTSICKNSAEYPYCVHTLQGVAELTQQYMALGRVKESDGQKILLELKKIGESLEKNMVDNAQSTLNLLIHYVGVKNGRTIPEDVGTILLKVLENTRAYL